MDANALDPSAWTAAAVAALREGGFDAVRVEALARDLGVTKGSFYWHFQDREALVEALLQLWERETDEVVCEAGEAPDPEARFERFFELAAEGREWPPDIAVFELAGRRPGLRPRVVATETKRMAFFAAQFAELGLRPKAAAAAAQLLYCASLGWIEFKARGGEPEDWRAFLGRVVRLCMAEVER